MAVLLLLGVVVMVWALVEVAQADPKYVRHLPRPVWVLLIALVFAFGPLAWFWLGRPKVVAPAPERRRPAKVPIAAPDDDPEFMRHIEAHLDLQRRLRGEPGPGQDTDGEQTARD
ncbi:MAG TPA: PLDc N-terminal domain-containing protein [Sporichthyaceae bacterium]|nr:PLDc N-terminal domain-containing protein [Sporichthyaceae bacterium]